MNISLISSLMTTLIISLFGSLQVLAVDMHGVMCGSDIRAADQAVVDEFMDDNPGANGTMEAVPWGTCQDKVINLDIKDPTDLFRIIKKIENNDLGFENITQKAKNYIDNELNEKNLINKYNEVFEEFFYYLKRYK